MTAERLSDAEWEELLVRFQRLGADEFRALFSTFSSEQGRIPTPADDGFSGWFARTIASSDEQLMQTRIGTGLWRWMLDTLRERQTPR